MGWHRFIRSASVTEANIAVCIITYIAIVTSALDVKQTGNMELGFTGTERVINQPLSYDILIGSLSKHARSCFEQDKSDP
jgi:hypothetical protein